MKAALRGERFAEVEMRGPEVVAQPGDCLLIPPSLVQRLRQNDICFGGDRIELNRALPFAKRLLKLAFLTKEMCIGRVRDGRVRIQS